MCSCSNGLERMIDASLSQSFKILLQHLVASRSRWVVVLGRSTLAQTDKVVRVPVVNYAELQPRVFPKTFHGFCLLHERIL